MVTASQQNVQISFSETSVATASAASATRPAPKVEAISEGVAVPSVLSANSDSNKSSSDGNASTTNGNGRPNNKRASLDNAFFSAIARRRVMSFPSASGRGHKQGQGSKTDHDERYTRSLTVEGTLPVPMEHVPSTSSSSTCSASSSEDYNAAFADEDAWLVNSLAAPSLSFANGRHWADSLAVASNREASVINRRNNKILKAVQSIIDINDTAIDCYRAGEYDASLDALREAEARREALQTFTPKVVLHHVVNPSSGSDIKCTPTDDDSCETKSVARSSYIYQRMDFDEGMHSYSELEKMDGSEIIEFPPSVESGNQYTSVEVYNAVIQATILFNVGQVHRRRGEFDSAAAKYEAALEVLTATSTSNQEEHNFSTETRHRLLIPILNNIGQLQYRRGELASAMETYGTALTHAKSMEGGSVHVASALNCLGVLHYHANSSESDDDSDNGKDSKKNLGSDSDSSTDKAMELFQQALAMRIKCLGPDHVDVATTLNNIGRIYVQNDQFDRALGYYQDALRIRRISLGTNSLDYAATAFNAGQSLHQKGDLDEAARLYHEFLRVATLKFGRNHRDVAVVLSGIAQIHQEKREFEKALELYEESLAAGKAALGDYHSEIAMLLNRMGNFHFERERLDEALKCYRRGLRIEKKVLRPDHPNIIVTYSNLGEIHRQRNEWEEAANMYGEALEILRRKYYGVDNSDVASTLNTLGLIHDQRGDTCLSLHFLQDALLMRRRLMGNNVEDRAVHEQRSLDVAATLVYIGTILYRKSLFPMAIELYTESLQIRQKILGKDHRDTAFVMYNIALVHQQRGDYEQSIEFYTETLRIEKIVLGERHKDVCMTLYKLGEVNKAAGKLTEALQCFQESLEIERSLSNNPSQSTGRRQQQSGSDPATMARTLTEIGNIHLAQGDVVPMMDAFNEASRLFRAAGLSPHNVVVSGHLYALEFSFPEAAPAA
ncbi:hypothetical protein HJC23_005892 [Cyclotella cryptica]|uniref:Kinesin light chain n=1 Tax=Cyclotella cryptica TaxID=29204 RepID=A0ABD3QZI3_9STRA|eukprot:CCRYP_000427-RA/>CCRYP_000427-RA protein AED:0.26 eAED:0.26 QI:892/1/1/1/0/0/2/76/953